LAQRPEIDSTRVWQVTPWAALNNTNDSSGIADLVVVRDGDGIVSDAVAYSAAGVPAGVPIEWRDGAWLPARDPRGTPLSPPRALPPVKRRFDLSPPRVTARDAAVRIEWSLPWPRARVRVTLFDLDGREIAQVLPESSAAGRGGGGLELAGLPAGVFCGGVGARRARGGGALAPTPP